MSGTLQAMLVFDNQLPFPHVSKITGTFVSRSDEVVVVVGVVQTMWYRDTFISGCGYGNGRGHHMFYD